MKPQPDFFDKGDEVNSAWFVEWRHPRTGCMIGEWVEGEKVPAEVIACSSYGKAGDIRYMREPIYRGFGDVAYYQDDDVMVQSLLTGEAITWRWKKDVLSGLYMPKEAARTFKRYEFIRVERLHDLAEGDAGEEGVQARGAFVVISDPAKPRLLTGNLMIDKYAILWDSLNAKRGYPWSGNWWVWVIGYAPFDPLRASPTSPKCGSAPNLGEEEPGVCSRGYDMRG